MAASRNPRGGKPTSSERRADPAETMPAPDRRKARRQAFIEEYLWLRSFRMSDARIASAMRIAESALVRRRLRAGIRGGDAEVLARLAELIASGREFDAVDFSLAFNPSEIGGVLAGAARDGLIVRVRTRPDPLHNGQLGVYRAVEAGGQKSEPAA